MIGVCPKCGREFTVNTRISLHRRRGYCSKQCGYAGVTTHGEGSNRTPEYRAWRAMKVRCFNTNSQDYPNYGGRGITVCDRWRNSYENFLADMGRRPSARHSIDRYPDKNGNYERANCRWATPKEQANNRRKARPKGFKKDEAA